MNKLKIAAMTACVVLMTSNVGWAQDDDWTVIPVEIFTCSYNDGKGPADLESFLGKFNDWADKNRLNDYSGWILTPFYFGPGANAGFDFVWLGASKNPISLGKAQDMWLKDSDGLAGESLDLWSCASHGNMASVNHKPKKTPKDGIITMSDCNYQKNATFDGLGAAMADYADVLEDAGSKSGIFHWYPVYGGGGESYDFKWVESFDNLEQLGEDYDRMANGKLFVKRNQLMAHLVSCDSARAYNAKSFRHVELR